MVGCCGVWWIMVEFGRLEWSEVKQGGLMGV